MAQRSLRQQPEQQVAPMAREAWFLATAPALWSAHRVSGCCVPGGVLGAWRGAACLAGCCVPGGVLRAWREAFG